MVSIIFKHNAYGIEKIRNTVAHGLLLLHNGDGTDNSSHLMEVFRPLSYASAIDR
jgi:hypothetical protein